MLVGIFDRKDFLKRIREALDNACDKEEHEKLQLITDGGIYTPDEVRKGLDFKTSLKDDYVQAAIARREQNKKAKCDK